MKKVETKVVKTFGGHCVQFTIGHQTFSLQRQEDDEEMSSHEYANWYKQQLDKAFDRLLQSENTAGGSPSIATSGGYTMLGKGTQAVELDESSQEGVKSPLGKRTQDENICPECGGKLIPYRDTWLCDGDDDCGWPFEDK